MPQAHDPGFDVPLATSEVEALLGRPQSVSTVDLEPLRESCVLVTGAGGSIGGLLTVALARAGIRIVALDRAESGLFRTGQQCDENDVAAPPIFVVGDAGDPAVEALLERNAVRVILHAAAHKHVGFMEDRPAEARRNNVTVTRALLAMAHRANVADFVLLSTDKAVEPISVMGRTKREAERWVLGATSRRCAHRVIRLPNVLGSAGSVVQVYRRRARLGLPLVVRGGARSSRLYLSPDETTAAVLAALVHSGSGLFIPSCAQRISTLTLARRALALWGGDACTPPVDSPLGLGERPDESLTAPGEKIVERCGPICRLRTDVVDVANARRVV